MDVSQAKVLERREQLLRMLRLAVRRVILQLRAERRQFGKGAWGGTWATRAPADRDCMLVGAAVGRRYSPSGDRRGDFHVAVCSLLYVL
jgi:hypothetical protein